jgi:DNA repair protein RadC
MPLKDLPTDAQPREKLLARGPSALSDVELLELKKTRTTRPVLTALLAC